MKGWVLLIDTDRERLRAVSKTLLSAGMRVSCAKSVGLAVSFMREHLPDLVLLHSCLPEAMELVRALDSLPVLLLTTGEEGESDLEGFFEAGVSDILRLPPPIPRVLCARVANLIGADKAPGEDAAAGTAAEAPTFPQVEGIAYEEALKNCGGEDVLKEVFQKFYESIEEKATAIEGFVASEDWNDYRIAVHSLKSSARLIGALQLSEEARVLEYEAGELKVDGLVEKTPALLALYRSYREKLRPLVRHEDDAAGEKPALSGEDFLSACRDLRECIGISDFDSADFIIKSLDGYTIPEEREEFIAGLRKAVGDVNKQGVLSLLESILGKE